MSLNLCEKCMALHGEYFINNKDHIEKKQHIKCYHVWEDEMKQLNDIKRTSSNNKLNHSIPKT